MPVRTTTRDQIRDALLVVAVLAGAEAAALDASAPSPPHIWKVRDTARADAGAPSMGKLVLTRLDERTRLRTLDDMNAFERAQASGDCALFRPLLPRAQCGSGRSPASAALSGHF